MNLLEQSGVSIRHGQNTEWTQWFIIRVPIIGRHSLSVFGSILHKAKIHCWGLPVLLTCHAMAIQATTSIIQYLKRNPYLLKKAASVLIKKLFCLHTYKFKMCQLSKHRQWKALSRREGIVEKHLGVF